MTRFNISLSHGVNMVLWALQNSTGGEIFIPKLPSYNIMDLANAIGPTCKKNIIGCRPGEKIHEEMITSADSFTTFDINNCYVTLPANWKNIERLQIYGKKYKLVQNNFNYSSESNKDFLTIDQIRQLIRTNIDPNFVPI